MADNTTSELAANMSDPELRLRSFSQYKDLDEEAGGLSIVSGEGKLLRVMIRYGTHKVWLQERPGDAAIQLEVGRGRENRWSTGTRDWKAAVEEADAALRGIAMQDHIDRKLDRAVARARATGSGATLLEIEDNFYNVRFSEDANKVVSDKQIQTMSRIFAIMRLKKGGMWRPTDKIKSAHAFVSWYVRIRTQQEIHFPDAWERRDCGEVPARTAIKELKDFSSALNRAKDKNLIPSNPLYRFDYTEFNDGGDAGVEVQREEVTLDYLTALLHPPVHPESDEPLLDPETHEPLDAPVNRTFATDGGARLRYLLVSLARSGRRISEFCGAKSGGRLRFPRVGDLLFTVAQMKEALRQAPNHRVRWAKHYSEHGAFVAARNKKNFHRIIPLSRYWRAETDAWLELHPTPENPRSALIPSVKDPMKPLHPNVAYKWLVNAEQIARQDLERMGLDADEIVPEREGSAFHGIRPCWRTVMTALGWDMGADEQASDTIKGPPLNKHALFYGGWSLGTGTVQARIYSRLIPEHLVAVAEFTPAKMVMAQTAKDTWRHLADVFGRDPKLSPATTA